LQYEFRTTQPSAPIPPQQGPRLVS
jgi:hypothetical protein